MVRDITERLESLRVAIEELRTELYTAIARDSGRLDGSETYAVSENLDELVAQFLRVKEMLDGEKQGREAREMLPPRSRLASAYPGSGEY